MASWIWYCMNIVWTVVTLLSVQHTAFVHSLLGQVLSYLLIDAGENSNGSLNIVLLLLLVVVLILCDTALGLIPSGISWSSVKPSPCDLRDPDTLVMTTVCQGVNQNNYFMEPYRFSPRAVVNLNSSHLYFGLCLYLSISPSTLLGSHFLLSHQSSSLQYQSSPAHLSLHL